jgi:hypothetical protein
VKWGGTFVMITDMVRFIFRYYAGTIIHETSAVEKALFNHLRTSKSYLLFVIYLTTLSITPVIYIASNGRQKVKIKFFLSLVN